MLFKNYIHEKRFISLFDQDGTYEKDSHTIQLFYIISACNPLWKNRNDIYDFENHCLNDDCFDYIDDSPTGMLLQRALHLYNGCIDDVNSMDFVLMSNGTEQVLAGNQLKICAGRYVLDNTIYIQEKGVMVG